MFISIFLYLFVVTRVNHTLYWVKIQERKILEFSRFTNLSDQISISILLSQIFQEAVPYFTKTPQHRGLVIFFYGPPRLYRILLYSLYYCILFFYKDLFFSFYRYFIGAKYFIHFPIEWVTMSKNHIYWVSSITFFFFIPNNISALRDTISKHMAL